jgi:hypothetical protein
VSVTSLCEVPGPTGRIRRRFGHISASRQLSRRQSAVALANVRLHAIGQEQYAAFFDDAGHISDWDDFCKVIFYRGLSSDVRCEVCIDKKSSHNAEWQAWKFLLEYYPRDATASERAEIIRARRCEYTTLRRQWMHTSVTDGAPLRVLAKNVIKVPMIYCPAPYVCQDAARTDRDTAFFSDAASVRVLTDILITHCLRNAQGDTYAQGLSDLVSLLLAVLKDEVICTFFSFSFYTTLIYG